MSGRRIVLAASALAGVLATAAPVAVAQRPAPSGGPAAAPKPFLDVRDARRRAVARRGDESLRAPSAATRSARARLRRAAGGGLVLEIDELTGTPRTLARTDEPLSDVSRASAADVARRYLREQLPLLGLGAGDLGSLRVTDQVSIPGGIDQVSFRQHAGAIPAFDAGTTVSVAEDGRVLSVVGAVQPGLELSTVQPAIGAAEALRRLMEDVGVRRHVVVRSGPDGVRQRTEFAGGAGAELVAFGTGTSARLAWRLDARLSRLARYVAAVDAATGEVLYRANQVKMAVDDALVWEQYPGAAGGGTAVTKSLTPYLDARANVLSGPYARAWSDVNDDFAPFPPSPNPIPGEPDPGEEVQRRTDGTFAFPFTDFTAGNPNCAATAQCSWNFGEVRNEDPDSWRVNREQSAVQAFYLVNRFRDRLVAPPISFSAADGNFEGADRVLVNAHDGADTFGDGGPDDDHMNNAFMDTPPDGQPPVMGMFLFANDFGAPFRDVNGGDDAAIVYHEYTHGLSGRLVTHADGTQALNGNQPGAMGEGWSDFYAKDFLVEQFPGDDTAAAGEVDMGDYIDAVPHSIRFQALDCPVGAPAEACPAPSPAAGPGGYTYGDFGKIAGSPEVHADGEIWAQTLWDLRAALGSSVTRGIVTQGMRLSPPEPSFLDARDAILLADESLHGGSHHVQIWEVFARRGMGTNASDVPSTAPVEGFNRPPNAALTATPAQTTTGVAVQFDGSASADPDGPVVSYRWDFDGNGTLDRTTVTPVTSHAYGSAGTFQATVSAVDAAGASDSASTAVLVAAPVTPPPPPPPPPPPVAPPPPPAPPASVRPSLELPRSGTRGRVRFAVQCDSPCTGRATLTVSRALARKLRLGRTVAATRVRLLAAGRRVFTIRLSRRAVRAMRREGVRRVVASLRVSVADGQAERTTVRRTVRIRR